MRRWIWGLLGIAGLALLGLTWRSAARKGWPPPTRESSAALKLPVSKPIRFEIAKPSITPPPALAKDHAFNVEPVTFKNAKPAGFAPAGPIFKFGPSGQTFPQPVAITVPYDPRVVAKGVVLALWTRGEGETKWSRVEGAVLDVERHVLVARVSHFSLFTTGQSCTDLDGDGFDPCTGDCDETDPNIHAGAPEICGDRIDQNCNGILDEGCPSEW